MPDETESDFEKLFWLEYSSWDEHRCYCGDPGANPPCGHCTDCWVCWCVTCDDWHMDKPHETLLCVEEDELMYPEREDD